MLYSLLYGVATLHYATQIVQSICTNLHAYPLAVFTSGTLHLQLPLPWPSFFLSFLSTIPDLLVVKGICLC